MLHIDSFRRYFLLNRLEFVLLTNQLYENINFLTKEYTNFKSWFFYKTIMRIYLNRGDILFILNSNAQVIALSCIKEERLEKKLCTIYVNPLYRHQKMGTKLISYSFIS